MRKKNGHVLHLKIFDGSSVLKRDLKPGERLRLGLGTQNDIVVIDSVLPKTMLFMENRGRFAQLRLHPSMRGTLSYRDSTLDLRDLMGHELLPSSGDCFLLRLLPGRTGTILIGEVQIAFYFDGVVEMRPAFPAFDWKAAWRRSLSRDLFFKALVLILLVGEFFWGMHLRTVKLPPEEPPKAEQVPQRFARFIVRPPERQSPLSVSGSGSETTPERSETRRGGERRGGDGGSVGTTGLLGLIGGREGGRSRAADFLLDQGVARQLDELLSGGRLLQSRGGRGGSAGSGEGLLDLSALSRLGSGIDESAVAGGIRTVELQKQGDVAIELPQSIRASGEARGRRTAESVMAVINAQRGRVMYTYNKYLRQDPELEGKVSFDVTIAADGRVTEVRIVEATIANAEFIAELTAILRGLKFPSIEAGIVTVNVPFVFHRAQ
ncbi:MAG: AgmX/PglI C-terminal domain-containing protein [candidate division KSB1 bacterium]|nr:AgmX/PglI C-terminal domain-containing protein [candidate division KSB1 bacterium]